MPTNDITSVLNSANKTTPSFEPGTQLPFEVHVQGTFVAKARLQVSFDDGATWSTLLTFETDNVLGAQRSKRAGALYRVSVEGPGDFTSGTINVFIGRGASEGEAYEFVKVVGPDGRTLNPERVGVVPYLNSGGHDKATTNSVGSSYVALPGYVCKQVTIFNTTGTTIEITVGGAGVAVPLSDGDRLTFYGLSLGSDLWVRRKDVSNTQVDVIFRWEN